MAMMACNRFCFRVTFLDIADEAAVDLDLVERELPQVAQAGIASAEIVHGDADAKGLQRCQDAQRILRVVHQGRLGDFQLQAMGWQPGFSQHFGDRFDDAGMDELRRRQVHRQGQRQ